MALHDPNFGEGTILEVSDGGGGAMVELDDYVSITPPAESYAKVARKVLRRNRTLNVVGPVIDVGDLTFVYETNSDSAVRIRALLKKVRTWALTYVDGLKYSFTGTLYSNTPGTVADGNTITTDTAVLTVQSLVAVTEVTALTLPTVPAPPLSPPPP